MEISEGHSHVHNGTQINCQNNGAAASGSAVPGNAWNLRGGCAMPVRSSPCGPKGPQIRMRITITWVLRSAYLDLRQLGDHRISRQKLSFSSHCSTDRTSQLN